MIARAALNLSFHVRGIDLQALLNHDLSGVIRFVPEIWRYVFGDEIHFRAIRARDSIYISVSVFRTRPRRLMTGGDNIYVIRPL